MFWIWLLILILFVLIELITDVTTTIWFIIASLISLVLSIFVEEFLTQFIVFTIITIILFVKFKEPLDTLVCKLNINHKEDKLIKMEGIVLKEINKDYPGIVKVGKKKINAIAKKKLLKGKKVVVLKKIGLNFLVEEIKIKKNVKKSKKNN